MTVKRSLRRCSFLALLFSLIPVLTLPLSAQTNAGPAETNALWMITRPLSLADALNISLAQNATNINARHDLEASHGIVMQTRAILLPSLTAGGSYLKRDQGAVDSFPITVTDSSGSNVT